MYYVYLCVIRSLTLYLFCFQFSVAVLTKRDRESRTHRRSVWTEQDEALRSARQDATERERTPRKHQNGRRERRRRDVHEVCHFIRKLSYVIVGSIQRSISYLVCFVRIEKQFHLQGLLIAVHE